MKFITQPYPAVLNTSTKKQKSKTQRGFTLIELMIAMTIGLIVMLVIGTAFTSSRQAFRVQEDNARIQESGRFALEIIGHSIKQAGYAEIPFADCKLDFAGTPINGTDGIAGAADTFTVQYDGVIGDQDCTGTAVTDIYSIIQNHFNLDNANAELQCSGSIAAPVAPPTPPTCANPVTPVIPAAPLPPPTGVVLLENIEDLQVLYGVDTTSDQSVNRYVAVPVDWNLVLTARVCVLIRSERTNVVTSTAGTYTDCVGVAQPIPADRRLRRAFTETFSIRNRVNGLP